MLGTNRNRAMANYVMGLCSSPNINHPVEITDNPFCHYTYSNLTKVLSFWELENEEFLKFVKNYLPPEKTLSNGKPYRMLSHLDFGQKAQAQKTTTHLRILI